MPRYWKNTLGLIMMAAGVAGGVWRIDKGPAWFVVVCGLLLVWGLGLAGRRSPAQETYLRNGASYREAMRQHAEEAERRRPESRRD